jgi:hypothetical protein
MIRESRQVWVAAHPRRLPSRNTQVHDELRAARVRDLINERRLQDELAEALEAELERM